MDDQHSTAIVSYETYHKECSMSMLISSDTLNKSLSLEADKVAFILLLSMYATLRKQIDDFNVAFH